jgi:uncharacterized protein (DUF169 family)
LSTYQQLAANLTARLNLDIPPVALAFAAAPPPGVARSGDAVPSACAFWRAAEKGVFFADAASHYNCPVGSMVMGFNLPDAVSQELIGLVGKMTACGYISGDEPARIPVNGKPAEGIVYGPLAEFPIAPDAVLLWLKPAQAMIWSEASGGADWSCGTPTTVFGRPACAAIPAAMGGAQPTMSLGCVGMRTFTGIGDDRMLAVLPGDRLDAFVAAAATSRSANDVMGEFYEGRKRVTGSV